MFFIQKIDNKPPILFKLPRSTPIGSVKWISSLHTEHNAVNRTQNPSVDHICSGITDRAETDFLTYFGYDPLNKNTKSLSLAFLHESNTVIVSMQPDY